MLNLSEQIENGDEEKEFPDFNELYEILSDEFDLFVSLLEEFIETESDDETKFNNQKYFSVFEQDYETFLMSLKNLLSLLDLEDEEDENE